MWLVLLLLLIVIRHAELVHALHVHRVQPAEIDLVRKILYCGQTSNAFFFLGGGGTCGISYTSEET